MGNSYLSVIVNDNSNYYVNYHYQIKGIEGSVSLILTAMYSIYIYIFTFQMIDYSNDPSKDH